MTKIIAITGHSGVIGSEFSKKFKKFNYVKCKIDLTDRKKVYEWIKNERFDYFLHFAAIVSVNQVIKQKKYAFKVNYNGTKNIVDALLKYKSKEKIWFFFSSTSHVYKIKDKMTKIKENSKIDPLNYYGYSKSKAEKYISKKLKNTKIKYTIGRIFSFTHYKQNCNFFIPSVFKKIFSKNKNIKFENVNKYRDFIHFDDLLIAIKTLLENKTKGIFNIGSGKKISLKQIILKVKKLNDKKKNIDIIKNNKQDYLIAEISKLKKLKFKPKKNVNKILYNYYKYKF